MDVLVCNRNYDFSGRFCPGGTYQRIRHTQDGSYIAIEKQKTKVFISIATDEKYPIIYHLEHIGVIVDIANHYN
jgi:hypothetical protein